MDKDFICELKDMKHDADTFYAMLILRACKVEER